MEFRKLHDLESEVLKAADKLVSQEKLLKEEWNEKERLSAYIDSLKEEIQDLEKEKVSLEKIVSSKDRELQELKFKSEQKEVEI